MESRKIPIEIFDAVLLLKTAGYKIEDAVKIIQKIYRSKIPKDQIEKIYHNELIPYKPTPLQKALLYNKAYKLALTMKKLGRRKIAKKLQEKLGIKIPPMTIYWWITGKTKPGTTPLKTAPELGYIIGTALTDACRSTTAKLRVKDRDYAEKYAQKLSKITGKKYQISKTKDGRYVVYHNGTTIRYICKINLWKIIAYIYPNEFLKGAFDGDGGPCVSPSKGKLYIAITIGNSSIEFLKFVEYLLKLKNIHCHWRKVRKENEEIIIKNMKVKVKETYQLVIYRKNDIKKYTQQIGFEIKRKQQKLQDALTLLQKYDTKTAAEKWKKLYKKINGRWTKQ